MGEQGRRPAGPGASTASASSCAIGSSLLLPLVITSGPPTPAHQEMVQRRVRAGTPRGRASPGATDGARSAPTVACAGASTIGRRGDVERGDRARRRARTTRVGGVEVGHHHRERLVVARLAAPELARPRRRRWRRPPGGSRRSPSPPTIAPAAERVDRGVERVVAVGQRRPACASRHVSRGPHVRAGVGLGVEAPVGGIVVLGPARRAHREAAPSSWRAGRTGTLTDDRVARPAVRAVRERVAVAAIGRIVDLGQAVVARGGVDAHRHRRRARPRRSRRCGSRRARRRGDRRASTTTVATRASGGGSSVRTALQRGDAGRARPRRRSARPRCRCAPSREPERDRVPVHERAEADALHGAGDAEQRAGHRCALSRSGAAGRRRACRRCGCRRTWCGARRCPRARRRSRRSRAASAPSGCARIAPQRGVGLVGRARPRRPCPRWRRSSGSMPRRSHAPFTAGQHRQGRLVEHHGEAGVARELVGRWCRRRRAWDRAASACRGAARRGARRRARPAARCRSGCRLSSARSPRASITAMPWSAMVPDTSTTSPGCTCAAPSVAPGGITPTPAVVMNSPSAAPRPTTLVSPVTICTPAAPRRLGHVGDDLAQLVDREALLDHERRRQPRGLRALHREVVHGAVHREVADRAAREPQRLHHERVGAEREPLARRRASASPRRASGPGSPSVNASRNTASTSAADALPPAPCASVTTSSVRRGRRRRNAVMRSSTAASRSSASARRASATGRVLVETAPGPPTTARSPARPAPPGCGARCRTATTRQCVDVARSRPSRHRRSPPTPMVSRPRARRFARTRASRLRELPLVEMPSAMSPGPAWAISWREKTSSKPTSLARAVSTAGSSARHRAGSGRPTAGGRTATRARRRRWRSRRCRT